MTAARDLTFGVELEVYVPQTVSIACGAYHHGVQISQLPRGWNGLMAERDYWPVSECDSEVLGLMIEDSKQDGLLLRCVDAVDSVTHNNPLVMLGLWQHARGGRLVAIRRGNPLHFGITEKSIYIASLAKGLPGKVAQVKNGDALEFRSTKQGSLKHVGASVLV